MSNIARKCIASIIKMPMKSILSARNSRVEEDLVDQLFNSNEKRLARTLRALSEGQVRSDDRRAVFVGAKAYEEAAGVTCTRPPACS